MFLGAQKSVSVPWWLNAYSRVVLAFKSLPTCPAEPLSAHLGYVAWLTKMSQSHSGLTWGPAHPCGVGLHIWSGHQPFQGGAWGALKARGGEGWRTCGEEKTPCGRAGWGAVGSLPLSRASLCCLTRLWQGVLGMKREGAFSQAFLGNTLTSISSGLSGKSAQICLLLFR